MPSCQVDKGAIKFVLGGANIMCPGMTSPGGKIPEIEKGKTVKIMAEDKIHPIGIGFSVLNPNEM